MNSRISSWHSIKTRATVFTLTVFVASIWVLSFYATRLLQDDMERVLGEQQFSSASIMAHDINDQLADRMQALESIAKQVTPEVLGDPPTLQALLEQRPLLQILFSGGVWAAATDGIAIADVPPPAKRLGTDYLDVDFIAAAIRQGKASISRPIIGKKRMLPTVVMVVPIRDAQGTVVGVLSGVTDLNKPNFLNQITERSFGKTGGYELVSTQHRQVITATESGRVMELLPAPGVNASIDRFINGYEGFVVSTNSKGVEVLASGKGIPIAGWTVMASLPTAEAFAPIHDLRQRMFLATLILTVLTGALTWWILKRQLLPLIATSNALATLADSNQMPQPLPVTRQDEIGQLIECVNQLLNNYDQREASLRASEAFKNTVLNSLDAEIAVIDCNGNILAVNEGWQQFALNNGIEPGQSAPKTGVGTNYFEVCRQGIEACDAGALDASAGLRAVLNGSMPSFTLDYPCDSQTQQRWFAMKIMPLGQGAKSGAVVTHTDITAKKKTDAALLQADRYQRALLDNFPFMVWLKDNNGHFLAVNQPFADACDHSSADLIVGKTDFELWPLELAQAYQSDDQKVLSTGNAISVEEVVSQKGLPVWCETYKSPVVVDGQIKGTVGFARDITDRKKSEEALRIAATAFESQQGIAITNASGVILRVNKAFTTITGYSAVQAVGQNPRILKSDRHDNVYYEAMYQALKHAGSWAGEIWNRRKNGEIYPEWLNISAVKDSTGITTHYVAIFTDISERFNALAQIDTLAYYDPLTQLPNRSLLMNRLEQALHSSTRHSRKYALLFVDLDNFKTLNDTLGHHQGDRLLVQVAQRLKSCIRDGDTLARLGSDEFVVMLEDLSEDDIEAATQAETVGESFLKAFQQDFQLIQSTYHSSSSIGITLFGGELVEGNEQPLKRSELAMFHAKAAGRNTLRFFDAKMQAEVSAHAALEADLREAVQHAQFLLHYQPQVSGDGFIIGVEALVRWQHPQRGLVSPAKFIALAEESGLILPIGQWVLDTACAQLASWSKHPHMAHLTMAVNVSARQFKQANFVDSVINTLARTEANPKRLKLELTESMLVDDVDAIIAKMGVLKTLGVTFSLDDFGTGYSSLAYLKRMPLDQLKIDQGFVRNIVSDPNDAAIAKMVVGLSESMGLSVIAEGVELQSQADCLARLGCHEYQGYLFSRPLPLAAFEAFVTDGEVS